MGYCIENVVKGMKFSKNEFKFHALVETIFSPKIHSEIEVLQIFIFLSCRHTTSRNTRANFSGNNTAHSNF